MFNKRGSPEPTLSVHDGATGKTQHSCQKCGKMTDATMTKQAFVTGEKCECHCAHCAHPLK